LFFSKLSLGDWPVPENPRSGSSAVKREWKGQIEKFQKTFGRTPDGISSHEHTHYFPAYFKIALDLAKQYNISFIRFGKKGFLGERNSVYLILKIMRRLNKRKFLRSKIYSPDHFVSLDWIKNFDEFQKIFRKGK